MPFDAAVREAARYMNDYRCIKVGQGRSRDTLRPKDTILAHRATRRFLEATLSTPFAGETVVVTHHAPSFRSLRQWDPEHPHRFLELDWCYSSDLEFFMHGATAPVLWIHGHIHASRDYQVGDTRIVTNPRGYPRENLDFDPSLVVEIEPRFTPSMKV